MDIETANRIIFVSIADGSSSMMSNPTLGYSDEVRRECLLMYVNGIGFRGIERVKGVHHTTVINWVKAVGKLLPDAYNPDQIPEVGELDELETFVHSKKRKSGCGQP